MPNLMLIQHNLLRLVRKRSYLTQVDIASILSISDYANVSRWEAGLRLPNVEALLTYHLLFDVPIESLFERYKEELLPKLAGRISDRAEYLKGLPSDEKLEKRIAFLGAAAGRLSMASYAK